jgi:hypothetical protein
MCTIIQNCNLKMGPEREKSYILDIYNLNFSLQIMSINEMEKKVNEVNDKQLFRERKWSTLSKFCKINCRTNNA